MTPRLAWREINRFGSTAFSPRWDTGATQPKMSLAIILAAKGAVLVPEDPWAVVTQRVSPSPFACLCVSLAGTNWAGVQLEP